MSPEEATEAVNAFREAIDRDGLADAIDAFDNVSEAAGPELIRPLLLMRHYHKDDNHLHERYEVIHIVEGFPKYALVRELINASNEMCRSSHILLEELVSRLINSDEYAPLFLSELDRLPANARKCIRGILTDISSQPTCRPFAIKNCNMGLFKIIDSGII